MHRPLALLPLACCAAGCMFDTSYDLVSAGTQRRQLVAMSAPDRWYDPAFDDSAWTATRTASTTIAPAADGTMPVIYIRQRFELGPDPTRWSRLKLSATVDGTITAYVNGRAMSHGEDGAQLLTVAPASMHPTDNVLALAIRARGPSVPINVVLDGDSGSSSTDAIIAGPYLLDARSDGITVAWETARAVASTLVVDGRRLDGGSTQRHFVHVNGLAADRSYAYHVETDGVAGEPAQLATAPAPGRRLRFAVYGDNRTNGDVHGQLVQALVAEAPDFVLNTGDMVGESTDSEWQTFFTVEYPLLRMTPLYPVMGNHEHDYGDDEGFRQRFPYAHGQAMDQNVYAFDYGSAHVAVLDSNGDLEEQSGWLERDLAAADARGQRSFVALHFGPVCGCSGLGHGSNDDASVITDVARRHHVAALFSGHNHLYERGVSGGVPYVVTGGGGAPLGPTGWIQGTTLKSFSRNHYVIVDVMGERVHVSARDSTGGSLDEADLPVR